MQNDKKIVSNVLLGVLLLSIIFGAGHRSIILKKNFFYTKEALSGYITLASNFRRAPGLYSWEECLLIREKPEEYVYTVGKSMYEPRSSLNAEIGWGLVLHFFLKEGIKGVHNIALSIAQAQFVVELFIIFLLFWAGKKAAGTIGACFAAFLYSTFKIPMVLMSFADHYYWTVPFSALSLFFWTVIYKPEDENQTQLQKKVFFFIYGILMGFASFVRLYFLLLPLWLSPIIFIREKSIKKGVVLLLIVLLGQSVFMVPQVLYTKKHFGEFAFTKRGYWHLFLQGVGSYPNPWGIIDSGEVNLNKWAVAKGAPDMFKDGTEASEIWFKNEYFKMLKERPDIFINNFLKHFKEGLTVGRENFQFFGLVDENNIWTLRLKKYFPWMILSSFFIMFVLSRKQFWIAMSVFLQGLYLLLVVVTWFPNITIFIGGYIPVFILLLSIVLAVHVMFFSALIKGLIEHYSRKAGIKGILNTVRKNYCNMGV